jgi:serine/threonine protein kinase
LHIISGLTFVHSHDIIFGELNSDQCWLSSNLDLSLVGFINAGFRDRSRGYRLVEGDHSSGYGFAPPSTIRDPTKQTDLFWFGSTVYQLMTGYWPGHRSEHELVMRRAWLPLETECMGEIVHKCWNAGYDSAEEVKAAIITFVQSMGWEVEGDDNLKGFVAADLLS